MSATSCMQCGGDLPPLRSRGQARKWCSESCRLKNYNARNRPKYKATVCSVSFPECAACGIIFAARAGGKRSKRATCSDPCQRVHATAMERDRVARLDGDDLERHRLKKRHDKAVRRARINGADEVERFDPVEIYDRDGWICGICDEPVDRELVYPDRMSVSLDHVIPVGNGGPHTRANTRCSHLTCNIARGNRDRAVTA